MSDDKPTSRLPLITSILLAFSAGPCAISALIVEADGVERTFRSFQEGGFGAFFVVGMFSVAVIAAAVVGALRGAGKAVPWTVAMVFALAPWVVGVLGEHIGLGMAFSAVANADLSSRTAMLAMGYSEAANASIFGAWLSAALFGVLAISAALAARAEPATERRPLRALAVVPVAVGLFVPAIVAFTLGVKLSATLGFTIAALASIVAVAIAGTSLGKSESGRVGGSAIPAVVLALAAVVFTGVAELGRGESFALGAMATADLASMSMLVSRGIYAHLAAQVSVHALGLAVCVALAIVAALAVRSGAAKRAAFLDVGAMTLLLVLAAAIGLGSHARRLSLIDELLTDIDIEGVEPVPMPLESSPGSVGMHALVIGADGLRHGDGTVVPWSAGRPALAAALDGDAWSAVFLVDRRADGHFSAGPRP